MKNYVTLKYLLITYELQSKISHCFLSTRMKTSLNAFFIVIAFLLVIVDTVAKNNPPVPNPNGRTNNGIPTGQGLPIDENLPVLFVIALLLGIYIVYNHKFKTQNQA